MPTTIDKGRLNVGPIRPIRAGFRADFDAGEPYTTAQRNAMATEAALETALTSAGYTATALIPMNYNDKLFAYRTLQNLN